MVVEQPASRKSARTTNVVATRKTPLSRASSSITRQAIRTGGWANPSKTGELKFVDTVCTQGVIFAAVTFGAGTLLNGLASGSTATTRVGRKVTIKSMMLRWNYNMGATSTGGCVLRILIVYDKQSNATAPAITDILATDDWMSANNLSNRDRFVTLSDVITAPVGVSSDFEIGDMIYKRLNLETNFNAGNAGTVGDITSGAIYLFVAQSGSMATANGAFTASARVRYSDL